MLDRSIYIINLRRNKKFMTREEDYMEQKASTAKKEEKNQNKFTEVCIHGSFFFAREGNGNDYL